MMIEITMKDRNGKEEDIAVNDKQIIRDAIQILSENHMIFYAADKIYSVRRNTYVDDGSTFTEAGIFNGDILLLSFTEGEENHDDAGRSTETC